MLKEFSYWTRNNLIDSIDGDMFDVLVIGGGIVGAGIIKGLSELGIKAMLTDKGDFASGTSSGSSKLIHGGLRYLQQGRLGYSRTLLKERNYLIKNSSVVQKIWFNLLVDKYSWKKWEIRMGLFLYSMLGGEITIPKFYKNKGEYRNSIAGHFKFYDGQTDDSRLVLYNIIDAYNNGAYCFNYLSVIAITIKGQIAELTLKDELRGKIIKVSAKVVINAAGPWSERVIKMAGYELNGKFRLSKGIHIIYDRNALPITDGVILGSHLDNRQVLIIPWKNVLVIGTTDRFVDDPDDTSVKQEDINYLIENVARVFPDIKRAKMLASYSGIRPLFGEGSSPTKISRDFSLIENGPIISVLGGKISDYRRVSKQVIGMICARLSLKINLKDVPKVNFASAMSERTYEHMIRFECAIKPEDILRRREGTEIYAPQSLEVKRKEVLAAFKKLNLNT